MAHASELEPGNAVLRVERRQPALIAGHIPPGEELLVDVFPARLAQRLEGG